MAMAAPAHILVFDSGAGGLGIAREIRQTYPGLKLSYLADNAAFPYGTKNSAFLVEHIIDTFSLYLPLIQPDIVVIACNTASTIALPLLREKFDLPFVGVVPAIKPAALQTRSGVIGVLATPETVKREYTNNLVKEFAPECEVILHGSNLLVDLAESWLLDGRIDNKLVASELKQLFSQEKKQTIDTIVLGCTHFPLIKKPLIEACHRQINWVDSTLAVTQRVRYWLQELKLEHSSEAIPQESSDVEVFFSNNHSPSEIEQVDTAYKRYLLSST